MAMAEFLGQETSIEPDDVMEDEGYSGSSLTSYVTSIASEIRRGIEENGRRYAAFGAHQGLPMDEIEQDRNNLQHQKFYLLLNYRMHLAPIGPNPQRILDMGTGSGIWAIDMADLHPSAEVIGVDVAAVQPTWVPPNCKFEIDDIEDEWLYPRDSYDLIYGRELLFSIRNYPRLIQQAFDHLRPGSGWLELSSTYPRVSCDDGTLPADSAYARGSEIFFRIADALNASAEAPRFWAQQMRAAGFVDVEEHYFKLPTNTWPKDQRLKKIGALELVNFVEGVDGFYNRGFIQYLGGTREELVAFTARAKSDARDTRVHSYVF